MKKKTDSLRNTRIAIVFFVFLVFFVSLSLVFKMVLVIRAGQFDSSKRFNLTISDNKNIEMVSFGPAEKTIAIFKLNKNIGSYKAGQFLKVPIDGFMISKSLDLNQRTDSIFLKAMLNYKTLQTNLTIIDLFNLLMFSKSIAISSVNARSISTDLTPLESDRIIGRLVSDELIEKDNQTIQIINGTDVIGLGNRLARLVTNMGGDVIIVATSDKPQKKSTIMHIDQKTYTVARLQKVLGYPVVKQTDKAISDITIIIGEDKVSLVPF